MTIQRAITIVNLILILLIAYFGVTLLYRMIATANPSALESAVSETLPVPKPLAMDQTAEFYRPIIERDLFRTKNVAAAQPAVQTQSQSLEALEETKLKLKLMGTVSGDLQRAYAVIEDGPKKEQNLYRIGDTIQHATLKMVLREKVVLTVAGKDEMLTMDEKPSASGRVSPMPTQESQTDESESMPPEDMLMDRAQRVSLNRSMIDDALTDVAKLMTEITVTPHVEEGQSSGLAISNIKPNSIFRRMGLRNGDILVGIDGQEIRSVDDAMRFYESLRSSSELKVQINRRGQERTIDYSIR